MEHILDWLMKPLRWLSHSSLKEAIAAAFPKIEFLTVASLDMPEIISYIYIARAGSSNLALPARLLS